MLRNDLLSRQIIIIIFHGLIHDFLSRFLIDFREIFREDVSLWQIFACKILLNGSLPVLSYVPFSDFFETHYAYHNDLNYI